MGLSGCVQLQLTSQDKQSVFYVIMIVSSSESEYDQFITKIITSIYIEQSILTNLLQLQIGHIKIVNPVYLLYTYTVGTIFLRIRMKAEITFNAYILMVLTVEPLHCL